MEEVDPGEDTMVTKVEAEVTAEVVVGVEGLGVSASTPRLASPTTALSGQSTTAAWA